MSNNEEKLDYLDENGNYIPAPSFEKAQERYDYLCKYPVVKHSEESKKRGRKPKQKIDPQVEIFAEINEKPKLPSVSQMQSPNQIPKRCTFKDHLNRLTYAARNEETIELRRPGNIHATARLELLEFLMKLSDRNYKIPEAYLSFFVDFFYTHPEATRGDYLKFIISATAKSQGYNEAINVANELAGALDKTKYHEPLINYSKWLKRASQMPIIERMLKEGKNTNEIASVVNMTSADVKVLMSGKEEFEFPDEQR